jgi:hypothetical protein
MNVGRVVPHVPFELFQFSSHLSLGLSEVPGRGGQDPALQSHLAATSAWLMWFLGLLDIATDLCS